MATDLKYHKIHLFVSHPSAGYLVIPLSTIAGVMSTGHQQGFNGTF